jgi:hypothetical protein
MKFCASLILMILVSGFFASAATTEDEAHFLKAVQNAYIKSDKDTIMALTCWDHVKETEKENAESVIRYVMRRSIRSIEYRLLDLPLQHVVGRAPLQTYTRNLRSYAFNLPIVKQIGIEYQDRDGIQRTDLYVGQKDGKLMIANVVPKRDLTH